MDWQQLRTGFPVTERWAFLDHAAVAPLPGCAVAAMREWLDDLAAHGVVCEPRLLDRIEMIRGRFGELIHADPLDVAFVKNTSEGVGIVAEGFPWQPGDNVVTAAEEYPANLYPWLNLASRGVETRLAPSRGPRIALDDLREAIDSRTRILSLSFIEYSSGYRNDLAAVGELCRERGIFFFVDAIQGLGVLPLDVDAMGIDALAADGHKWLLGPEGAGVLYVRRDWVERLRPVGVGWHSVVDCWNFTKIDFRLKPHAGRWESGSPNAVGIVGLGASLDLLREIGLPALSERLLFLTDHLCEEAARAGIEVFSSRRPEEKSGIVSLALPGIDLKAAVRRCRESGIVINQRAGRLRASPHVYNTTGELDQLIEVLRSLSR
jgi:selenocysteine lyase/cysteine desulfurase